MTMVGACLNDISTEYAAIGKATKIIMNAVNASSRHGGRRLVYGVSEGSSPIKSFCMIVHSDDSYSRAGGFVGSKHPKDVWLCQFLESIPWYPAYFAKDLDECVIELAKRIVAYPDGINSIYRVEADFINKGYLSPAPVADNALINCVSRSNVDYDALPGIPLEVSDKHTLSSWDSLIHNPETWG